MRRTSLVAAAVFVATALSAHAATKERAMVRFNPDVALLLVLACVRTSGTLWRPSAPTRA